MSERDGPPVETQDVPPRVMWLFLFGFAAFVAVSCFGLLIFFSPDRPWTFHRLFKPAPVLQISPPADHAEFLALKTAELTGYAWQDRDAGLVRIPIEEAMRLVSEGHRASAEVPQDDCAGAACPDATPTARTIP